MHDRRLATNFHGLAVLALLACGLPAAAPAATIPPGTVLDARQEMVRNNGSEPETLDPSIAESTVASNLVADLFEGLTATASSGRTVPGVAVRGIAQPSDVLADQEVLPA